MTFYTITLEFYFTDGLKPTHDQILDIAGFRFAQLLIPRLGPYKWDTWDVIVL